jgi:hypothetical protein
MALLLGPVCRAGLFFWARLDIAGWDDAGLHSLRGEIPRDTA